MQIGLIGGIGPAATDFYLRRLIAKLDHSSTPLDLTIVYTDSKTLLGNLERNDAEAQLAVYRPLTERLAAAGAGCVAVSAIAGHFCIGAFKRISPLPVIDMIEAVDADLERRAFSRVGILGTRGAMQTRLYGAIQSAEIVPPSGDDLDGVHDAYVAMAAAGAVSVAQKAVFDAACQKLIAQHGVEAIILGGTDLTLAYEPKTAGFEIVDCAEIHVDAIVSHALAR